MDFLVNPSTFSDAEMADILMHKIKKKIKKTTLTLFALYLLGHTKSFLPLFTSEGLCYFCMIQHGRSVRRLSCSQRLHHYLALWNRGGGIVFKIWKNTNSVTRHRPHYTARSDQHDKNKLLNFWHSFYCCIVIEKRLPVAKHKRGIAGLKPSTVDLSWQLASLLKLADGYNNLHRCWGGKKVTKESCPVNFLQLFGKTQSPRLRALV